MPVAATNRRLTVVALLGAMFLAAMEATAVSTAMPTVIGDLGGVELYAWVFTAYMLTSTITVPIYGKASDLFGRKPVLLFGMALFLAGSATCGLAANIGQLIAFRAIQGLGAGAVQPTAMTIVGDLFTLKERARLQALFASLWGIAGISGPLLGGFIVHYTSWRWIFYINLPFGLVATALLTLFYRENVTKKSRSIDWLGALLLTIGIVAILAAANGVNAVALGAAGALFLGFFIWAEHRAKDALLPVDLFSQRLIAVACTLSALTGAGMFSLVTYLPLYVQGAIGGTAVEAGSTLTPMMVGWPIASALAGRYVPRYGFRGFILAGTLITAIAAAAVALIIQHQQSMALVYLATTFFGIGLGLTTTPLVLAVQTSVPWERRGIATASVMFFRIIGGTLAVGFLGGYLAQALANDGSISHDAINSLLGPEQGQSLAPEMVTLLTGKLKDLLHPIFWSLAGIGGVFFLTGRFFPQVKTQ